MIRESNKRKVIVDGKTMIEIRCPNCKDGKVRDKKTHALRGCLYCKGQGKVIWSAYP